MSSAVVALIAAVFGVTGTLLASVFSQRSQAAGLRAEFERQQQAAHVQWERDRESAQLEQRRTCYIATNAAFRRYRVQLMSYLWRVHWGNADETASRDLEAARDGHHVAYAEAQMLASRLVLDYLDEVAIALGVDYRKTKSLEEGHPESDGSFEQIEAHLSWLWERWEGMRSAMRADLGVADSLHEPPQVASPQ